MSCLSLEVTSYENYSDLGTCRCSSGWRYGQDHKCVPFYCSYSDHCIRRKYVPESESVSCKLHLGRTVDPGSDFQHKDDWAEYIPQASEAEKIKGIIKSCLPLLHNIFLRSSSGLMAGAFVQFTKRVIKVRRDHSTGENPIKLLINPKKILKVKKTKGQVRKKLLD